MISKKKRLLVSFAVTLFIVSVSAVSFEDLFKKLFSFNVNHVGQNIALQGASIQSGLPSPISSSSVQVNDSVVRPPLPAPTFKCMDKLDNDGDGLTDYPKDPGCVSLADNDETNIVACPVGVDFMVKLSPNSPLSQGIVAPTTNTRFADFDVTSCINTTVSNLQIQVSPQQSVSSNLSNLKLFYNSAQIGTTIANPTSLSSLSYYINQSFTAGQSRTYSLYGDIKTTTLVGTKIQFQFSSLAWTPRVTSQIKYSPLPLISNLFTVIANNTPLDSTPRIAYWSGKVNQHIDQNGNWISDPDGASGASIDKLMYCKKWYPNTTNVVLYKTETITTWRRAIVYEQSPYTWAVITDKCVQSNIQNTSLIVVNPNGGEVFTIKPDYTLTKSWFDYKIRLQTQKPGTLAKYIIKNPDINNPGLSYSLGTKSFVSSNLGIFDEIGAIYGDFSITGGKYYIVTTWKSFDGTENLIDYSNAAFTIQ